MEAGEGRALIKALSAEGLIEAADFGARNLLEQLMEIAASRPAVFSLALVEFPLEEIPIQDERLVQVPVLVPPSTDSDVARLRLLQRGHPSDWNDDHSWKLRRRGSGTPVSEKPWCDFR